MESFKFADYWILKGYICKLICKLAVAIIWSSIFSHISLISCTIFEIKASTPMFSWSRIKMESFKFADYWILKGYICKLAKIWQNACPDSLTWLIACDSVRWECYHSVQATTLHKYLAGEQCLMMILCCHLCLISSNTPRLRCWIGKALVVWYSLH